MVKSYSAPTLDSIELHEGQLGAIDRLVTGRGGVAWMKVGEGKTRVGILAILKLMEEFKTEFPSICLVVLKPKAFYDFRQELATLQIDCVILDEDAEDLPSATQERMRQVPTFLLTSCGKIVQTHRRFLADKRIKFAIFDELYLYKNPKSERALAVQRIAVRTRCVGLSGSVMTAQKIEDIYGQLMAVYKHRLVAPNFTAYRGRFIDMKMIGREGQRQWPFRYPKPGAYKQIMELCKACTYVHFPTKSDRKVHHKAINIAQTEEQKKMFHDLREYMEVGDLELTSSLQVALKIQEIANGWYKDENGNYRQVKSNKPQAAVDLAKELIDQGEKLIFFCAFRHDVEYLSSVLHDAGIATLQFMSGVDFDIEKWKSGNVSVVVATEASCHSVNHFKDVAYGVYYSMNYKWLDKQQSEGRLARKNSRKDDLFYYYFQVEGSLDRQIYLRVNDSKLRESTLIVLGQELKTWLRKDSTRVLRPRKS